jgi:hypothetical protein
MTTTIENKLQILSELWLDYRDDENFKDFVSYNDLGLPLSYLLSANIVESTEIAERFIDETFDILLAGLGVEDTGFEFLDDLLESAK